MLGIGGIISGAAGALGGILGSADKNRSIRKQMQALKNMQSENQSWYDRRYNEDATQKADAQRILTMTEEAIRNRNRQAAGAAAVTGATDESVALQKAAGNKQVADAASQIAAAGEARKDAIENQYLSRKNALDEQMMGLKGQRVSGLGMLNNAIGGAAAGVSAGVGI